MKKIQFLLMLSLLALGSCRMVTFEDEPNAEPETSESTSSKGSKTMYFNLTGLNMTSMDGEDISNTRSSSNRDNATDHLILGIYTTDGQLIDSLTYQDKSDPDIPYGTFSRTLEFGRYTILALGWNGTQKCIVHNLDSITFSEGWVPNTFLCRQNIIVNESYSNTRTLSLKRCISRFKINFTDTTIPSDISTFHINFSGAGNTLNTSTRHCTTQTDFKRTLEVTGDPTKVKYITSYCFLPSDSTTLDINVVAEGKNGNTIAERTFTDVPMKINYSTNYTGNFFPIGDVYNSVTFEIDFDGEFNHTF